MGSGCLRLMLLVGINFKKCDWVNFAEGSSQADSVLNGKYVTGASKILVNVATVESKQRQKICTIFF